VPLDLVVFLIQFTIGVIVYGVHSKLFFLPWLKKLPRQRALMLVTIPHTARFMGLFALTQAAYNSEISQVWANSTAYGDLATMILAIVALLALNANSSSAIPVTWLCHLVGVYAFLDSTIKIFTTHLPVHLLMAGWFLPTLYVPLLFWAHIFAFRWLISPPAGKPSVK